MLRTCVGTSGRIVTETESVIDPALELGPLSCSFFGVFFCLKGWNRLVNFWRVMRGAGAPVDFFAVCLLRAMACIVKVRGCSVFSKLSVNVQFLEVLGVY